MKISIVAPVYNEEKQIVSFLDELKKSKLPVVLVDDGSVDKTNRLVKPFTVHRSPFTLLTHKVNIGKGAALKTGCEYAISHGANAVILMDSDGQHDVKDINKFVDKLNAGYDVVIGSRNLGFGVPLDRYMGNKIASVVVAAMFNIYVSDLICGYRALTKKAYKKINWESEGYGVEVETVIKTRKNNLKYCEVPVSAIYYDSFKGVNVTDAFGIMGSLIKWRLEGISNKK